MKTMKQYNEYEDKLVSVETALNAENAGYKNLSNKYDVECFCITKGTTKDKTLITDEWSGMIPDDMSLLAHRPTITGLQKWLREVHFIHVYVGFRTNLQKYYSWTYTLDMERKDINFSDIEVFDNYEEALEFGVNEGLKKLLEDL